MFQEQNEQIIVQLWVCGQTGSRRQGAFGGLMTSGFLTPSFTALVERRGYFHGLNVSFYFQATFSPAFEASSHIILKDSSC